MILKDRVAIVTGAGSGIGRASAEILGREGASVLVADRDGEKAAETARAIEQTGGRASAIAVDVSDDPQLDALVARCTETIGRIDILHCMSASRSKARWSRPTQQGWTDRGG